MSEWSSERLKASAIAHPLSAGQPAPPPPPHSLLICCYHWENGLLSANWWWVDWQACSTSVLGAPYRVLTHPETSKRGVSKMCLLFCPPYLHQHFSLLSRNSWALRISSNAKASPPQLDICVTQHNQTHCKSSQCWPQQGYKDPAVALVWSVNWEWECSLQTNIIWQLCRRNSINILRNLLQGQRSSSLDWRKDFYSPEKSCRYCLH